VDRWVVLLALAACAPATPAGDGDPGRDAPPVTWIVPPAPGVFPLGAIAGRLGRSQAPQPMIDLGIAAPEGVGGVGAVGGGGGFAPLHLATVLVVPGDGPARAVVHGAEGDQPAVELVDIDRGRVVWRDRTICAAPVVGVTAEVIVCADVNGVRALGLDGKPRWTTPAPFLAFTEERVVVSGAGVSIILDAATGDELAQVRLPRGAPAESILASCGEAGRELFAVGIDGRLLRIAEVKGATAVTWAVPMGAIVAIDACDGRSIVVTEAGPAGPSLVAIARATGQITGRVDGIAGAWPARDGSDRIEIAGAAGVARYPRDLAGGAEPLDLPPLGELLATRGDRRLVRATPLTAVLLDRAGVRAYVPLAAMGAVLGETSLLVTSWLGSPGEVVHRRGLPPPRRRRLRLPPRHRGVAVDAELRDLPPVASLDLAGAVALPDTGMHAVTGLAIDPRDGAAVYAIAIDERTGSSESDPGGAGVSRDGERAAVVCADLAAKRWRWQRVDGCGPGTPVGIAVARDVVVCGARRDPSDASAGGAPRGADRGSSAGRPVVVEAARATVRATSRDGAARWEFATTNVDAVDAGGDVVVVHDAGRITVLDARDGRPRGHVASDDGALVRVAIVVLDDATLVVTAERGRVVARLGIAGLLPVWSVAVAGVVRALAPSGEGVLVALEDGDAFRIDARTAAVVGLPGLGLAWHAAGDVVTGHTPGGPIPGLEPPSPPPTLGQLLRRPLQIIRGELNTPAPMSTPIPPPPPLGDSWQLTLYELAGGLRARNDYALASPVTPPVAGGPAGSPLVVAYGPGLREVVVIDPRTGDPLRRVRLPDGASPGVVFGTVVAGAPVAGTLLASPLRVVLF
jgi:outer membrane protein assembly factor BamB